MSDFVSVDRINALKSGIEAKTGATYTDLTTGVQALVDGYGVGSPVLTDLEITENGEYSPPNGVDGFRKVAVNVAGNGSEDYLAVSLTNTLTDYSNTEITNIIAYGLYGRTSLTNLYLPKVIRINTYGFYGVGITEISDENFPALSYLGERALRNCAALKRFIKPNSHISLGGICFERCAALEIVDVKSCEYVEGNQKLLFGGCTALTAFIIRNTEAVNVWLADGMFTSSGIASGTGYIYVPSALVESYKSATGWANWAEQIRAIEDYPEITGG